MRIILGPSLSASRDPANPAIEPCYERARELCDQLDDDEHRFPVLHNLWRFHQSGGRYVEARELSEALLAEGQRLHNPKIMNHRNWKKSS